jgi:hypothetical protein
MAFIDSLHELSDNQDVSSVASSADTVSSNVIDLGAAGEDGFGNSLANQLDGQNLHLNIQVGTAIAGNTLLVKLYHHTAAGVTSGTLVNTFPISTTIGVANAKFSVPIPSDIPWGRYIGVGYRGSGGSLSGGNVDCWIGDKMETKNTIPPTA